MTRDPVVDCNLSNQRFGIGIPSGSVQSFRKCCRGRAYNAPDMWTNATSRGIMGQQHPAEGVDTVGFRLVRSSAEERDAR